MTLRTAILTGLSGLLLLTTTGCGDWIHGDRPSSWDTPPEVRHRIGLSGSFALLDESLNAVHLIQVDGSSELKQTRRGTGKSVVNAKASPDGDRLFVLTEGDQPRRKSTDERPALWVYDGTGSGDLIAKYTISDPLSGLAIDPEGRYVVVYAAGSSNAFVANPNELVVIDTSEPPSETNPLPRTLRSFGGSPQRLTFTPTLNLPAGERRLLLVETDQDLSILDLDHLDRKEVTVRLSGDYKVVPAGVVFTDGLPSRNDDARVAVRTTKENSVFLLTLVEQFNETADNDFDITINIIGLTNTPSDFAFVNTDGGLRLAMLEPNLRRATLADPDTTTVTEVDMPAAFGRISLVTQEVSDAPASGSDVAMLWGGSGSSTSGVAFWSLGKSVGQAYRSIETLPDVASAVGEVVNVPAPNQSLKLLVPSSLGSQGGQFHVLDLSQRTASPLNTKASNLSLTVSADGQRAWFFEPGTQDVAVIDLVTLHPQNLVLDRPIWNVFDIARSGDGRAMVALHEQGAIGATIIDAFSPDEASAVGHVGLLQGGF
jgi:dipeptidyl aminopeptidase/acylaminoacyl peptidase